MIYEITIDSNNLFSILDESKNLKTEIAIIPSTLLQSSPETSLCGTSFNTTATIGYFEKIKDKVVVIPEEIGLTNIAFLSKDLNPFFKSIKDNGLDTSNLILGLQKFDINGIPLILCRYIKTQTKHVVINERQPHTMKVITTEQDIFAQLNTIPYYNHINNIKYLLNYCNNSNSSLVLDNYDLSKDDEFQDIMNNYKASDGIFPYCFKDRSGNKVYEYMTYINKSMLNVAKGDNITLEVRDSLVGEHINRFLCKYNIHKKSKKCNLSTMYISLKF